MRNITGSPVSGEDFFGRTEELARLRRAVEDGNHVLISSPRRIGKSSLVGQLCTILKADNWRVATADVQHATDEIQFVEEILTQLQVAGVTIPWFDRFEKWAARLRHMGKGIKGKAAGLEIEVGHDEPADWTGIADRIRKLLHDVAAEGKPLLVALDELPIFLARLDKEEEGSKRVAAVLHWLRSARQAGEPSVRWVICGSIGLDSFVETRGLAGTVNDFQIQTLGAFREPVAVEFLQRLGSEPRYRLPVNEDLCRHVLARIGWPLPYYLQLMFQALLDGRPTNPTAPALATVADVDTAFEYLIHPNQTVKFSHWDTRLGDQFAQAADADMARFLLKQICVHPQGVARDVLLADLAAKQPHADIDALKRRLGDVLQLLERDGYLLRSGDDYSFRSFLLREYWRRRFA